MPTFCGNNKFESVCIGNNKIKSIYIGDTLVYEEKPLPYFTVKCSEEYYGSSSIRFLRDGSGTLPSLQYSKNGKTWSNYTIGNTVSLNKGEKVYWKGLSHSFNPSADNCTYLDCTAGQIDISGNIYSLIDYYYGDTVSMPSYCFYGIFSSCPRLIHAKDLDLWSMNISSYCYQSMFYGCPDLVSAPALPATSLKDFCYSYMFVNCVALRDVQDELPATNLNARGVYREMYSGCTSLTESPELMFTAVTTSSSSNQYYQCWGMFNGCTSLRKVKVHYAAICFDDLITNNTFYNWLNGISTGTFYYPSSVSSSSVLYFNVPAGWTKTPF